MRPWSHRLAVRGWLAAALFPVLLLQAWDLLSRFSVLTGWRPAFLLFLSILMTLGLRARGPGRRTARRLAQIGLALSLTLSGIALFEQWQCHAINARWSGGTEARLSSLAEELRREFDEFLGSLTRIAPPPELPGDADDRGQLFRSLHDRAAENFRSPDRFGWTLWNSRTAEAWAGRTTLPEDPSGSPAPEGIHLVRRGAARVLSSVIGIRSAWKLEAEYLLQSPLETHPLLPLAALEHRDIARRVTLEPIFDDGEPEPAPPEGFEKSSPQIGGRPAGFTLVLRDRSGKPLLIARLRDEAAEEVLRRLTRRAMSAGILASVIAAVLGSGVFFRLALGSAALSGLWPLLAGSLLLWAGRGFCFGIRRVFPERGWLGYDRFGSDLAEPFFRSPFDLLLTAVFLAIQVRAAGAFLDRLPGRTRRFVAALGSVPLILLARFLFRFGIEAPRNARFDLLRLEVIPFDPARLATQAGIFLLFAAGLYLAWTIASGIIGRPDAGAAALSGRIPELARQFGFVALVAALYLPLLAHASHHQREIFFRNQLLSEVERQQTERRGILEDVLGQLARSAPGDGEGESGDGAAYRIWASTALSEEGLSSSLRIFSADGELRGRFGLNLPAGFEGGYSPAESRPRIRTLLRTTGGLRKRILEGSVRVHPEEGEAVQIQIDLLDEAENLPFVRADNIYVQLFRPTRLQRTNPELLGSEPLVALYDWEGRLSYCSQEGGLNLPSGALAYLPIGQIRWLRLQVGQDWYRALLKRGPDRAVVLGFLLPSRLEAAGNLVRHASLGVLAWGGISIFCLPLIPLPVRRRPERGRLSRRLLALFLTASMIPLLALAFFFHQFAAREIETDTLAEALSSLGSVRRIVEDYLAGTERNEESELGDDVAYWLSRVVRQDINLYRGEWLVASSTRELYSSGLLSQRLDPRAYESLVLRHDAFRLIPQRLADLDYQTIAAPISLGKGSRGTLTLPLAVKRREILRERADVDEAILLTTVALILLLALLAHRLARRVSDPISALAEAARAIEAGNLDAEVRVPARDEPALLINSFNRMAASLRRQREDLRRRSDYIEKILLNATTGVISTDAGGRVVTLNPAARLHLDLADAAPEGKDLIELLRESAPLAPLRQALENSRPHREELWRLDLARGERPRNLRVVSLPFRETPESPPGRILLLEDLTETVRSSRLEAWAEMARRIAHEIKNPLTPIQLSADHLRRVHRSRDPQIDTILEQCLDTIQKQVRTLRRIAADFSDYSRIPVLKPQRVAVAGFLDETLSPYRSSLPDGLRLECRVDPATPDLYVDPEATRRALVNLVQNGLEAMPEGGALSVLAEPSVPKGGPGALGVRIRIRDTGPGMDAETRARLFEPYFSTKNSGTGLGLSIVRRTAEEQGGSVDVSSELGRGTEVTLNLPAAQDPPAP